MLLSCPNTYFGPAPPTPSEMLLYAKHGVPLSLSLIPASLLCPTGQLPSLWDGMLDIWWSGSPPTIVVVVVFFRVLSICLSS